MCISSHRFGDQQTFIMQVCPSLQDKQGVSHHFSLMSSRMNPFHLAGGCTGHTGPRHLRVRYNSLASRRSDIRLLMFARSVNEKTAVWGE